MFEKPHWQRLCKLLILRGRFCRSEGSEYICLLKLKFARGTMPSFTDIHFEVLVSVPDDFLKLKNQTRCMRFRMYEPEASAA